MHVLLAVLNPRRIAECVESISALPVDKAWLSNMNEAQACDAFNDVVRGTDYDWYSVVSDDVVVPPKAWKALVDALDDPNVCYTGYCNLDEGGRAHLANLSITKPERPMPRIGAYWFPEIDEVEAGEGLMETFFTGMCLTTLSREMWLEHPMAAYMQGGGKGFSSDYHLSRRLWLAGVPMRAVRGARCRHVKQVWNTVDKKKGRELLVGKEPAGVRLDIGEEV